ncbi:MAG: LanC-like protein [Oligoflexales bacterium]
MLYEADRHTKLKPIQWSKTKAAEVIEHIFRSAVEGYDQDLLWKTHPNEDEPNPCLKTMYFGAAGILVGLTKLSRAQGLPLPFNPEELIEQILLKYDESPDTGSRAPAYFIGESGILLVHYGLTRSQRIADRLYKSIEENIRNPVNEALWGSPGTMVGALFMYEWTNEETWKTLYQRNADYLFEEWKTNSQDLKIWIQDLYGQIKEYVGAGHGFFGNVYSLLRGAALLSSSQRENLFRWTADTTIASVTEEGDLANWPPIFGGKRFIVQWCHGAPGAIASLEKFPLGYSTKLDSLLEKGGNLIWKAGPLAKGGSLCHGTAGNGYAFLKLYRRTGDEMWLERARAFAMHAIEHRTHRHTLWTGDLGLACYLLSCIEGSCAMPAWDSPLF